MKLKTPLWWALLLGGLAVSTTGVASEVALAETELAKKAKQELCENILPFWLRHASDRESGGFQEQVNEDLSTVKNAPRGALLSRRILWVFSAAHRCDSNTAYLQMASIIAPRPIRRR